MNPVDAYLEQVPKTNREELLRIRKIILNNIPNVQETISYGIPSYKYKNKYVIGFASFKNHLSLFPTPYPIEKHKDRLKKYKLSKGTIQFTINNKISENLIKQLIATKLDDIDSKS